MHPQTILLYDGSFDGFLSTVFLVYEQKIKHPIIRNKSFPNNQLFTVTHDVITEEHKAKRVWVGFTAKTTSNEQQDFFKAFLSEIKGVENTLLCYLQNIFLRSPSAKNIDFSNKNILKISQVAKMVSREKHRMEAFVRFQLTKDNIYVAIIEPDFNVLPLIMNHFKDRYADQRWLIYDIKRAYGMYYDLTTIDTVQLDFFSKVNSKISSENLAPNEQQFQELWHTYFKNVNIKSRKNTKLHLQHIPRRYWKYLTEKNKI